MRNSRGMGAISSSKMPNKKTITRTDNPDEVSMYKKGGSVKKMGVGGIPGSIIGEDVDGGSAGRGNNGLPSMTQEAISEMAQEAANRKKAPAKKKKFNTIPDLMENDGSARLKKGGRVKGKKSK